MATVDSIESNWVDNFDVIDRNLGTVIPEGDAGRVSELARAYLPGRRPLFEKRIADGMIRDGHGDLLADDIFCLDDGPRIIDCLAFNDDYRIGDVLADVTFLAMDVELLAGRPPAESFLAEYREFTGEPSINELFRGGATAAMGQCPYRCVGIPWDTSDSSRVSWASCLSPISGPPVAT